jgi:peptide/nickel transport system permease protein
VPNFWLAILLVLLFSILLQWFPSGGFAGWDAGALPALRTLLLPALALALPQAAILTRVTRSSVLEVLGEDYIRTARAKGLTRQAALWRHGVRNALIPVVTILGLQFSFLLAGTIIIENVFYLPGIGRLIFQAIAQRDLIVVKNVVLLLAATVVVVNFLVDLSYAALDPRLRLRGGHGH